jgi:formylglycine-generating enzyme required for sulfatase activity
MGKTIKAFSASLLIILTWCTLSLANNLSVSDVTVADRDPSADTLTVAFNISWENSWRTKINHDAVWITVRLYDPTANPTAKLLCPLSASGLNPAGTDVGSNLNLEISVPVDQKGAFLRPSQYGVNASVSSEAVQLTVDYAGCGFDDDDTVYVSVSALEMVYVPEGSFYAGDYDTSVASLNEGVSDTDPWYIASEEEIMVSNIASEGYRYVSNGHPSEDETGATFNIPAAYPKGFAPFYAMKYEVTEGQWVEFLNSLPSAAARAQRDITDADHKNSDSVLSRNTITCSGSPLTCSTTRPARAMSYLSWMDLAAFLDWMALRPMTELEFEKMARGPLMAVEGEYVWGTTAIEAATTLSASEEDGAETVVNPEANAHYGNVILSGGDAEQGMEYAQGPLRGGIFATATSDRESAGSSYYGIMELSGNIYEQAVTVGNDAGRSFQGSHGDGVLSTASGYAGNADQADWPGIDSFVQRGVTGAVGSGYRGGAWTSSSIELRTSDRTNAANAEATAASDKGGRGVRSYSENY